MKKSLIFVAFLSLILALWQILSSYAIFESNVKVKAESPLAKWQILINGTDVTGKFNVFNVETVNWEDSEYVMEGRAAPGLAAYFEIIIDPSGSDVSMKYDIKLDFLALNNDKIQLLSVKDEKGNELTQISEDTYSNIISLVEIKNEKVEKIRVNLIWINDEENNEKDSKFVKSFNSYITLPVSIKISQYFGEGI